MQYNYGTETIGQPLLFKQPLVPFKNNSGETMPAGGLGRVSAIASHGDQYYLTIEKPDTTFARWYLVNGPNPVGAGRPGVGYYAPFSQVYYDTNEGTPGMGESWGAKSGQWSLVKDRPGFTMLGVTDLSREDTVYAIQEPVGILTGKADSAITAGSTGTVSVHFAVSGTASEYNLTGHLKWMHNSEGISSGKEVLMQWVDGLWLITGAECE